MFGWLMASLSAGMVLLLSIEHGEPLFMVVLWAVSSALFFANAMIRA